MGLLLRRIMNVWRKVFGQDSAVERVARKLYTKVAKRSIKGKESRVESFVRSAGARTSLAVRKEYVGRSATVFRNGDSDRRVGIYMLGACDLPAAFVAKPFIREHLDGTCAIVRDGEVADSRSDFLIQLHENPPPEDVIRPVIERMNLSPDAFEPKLFRPTFTVPYLKSIGEFPKSAVILSTSGDATRTLYRHREHGFIVDPGGWWLQQPMEEVLEHMDKVTWLRERFEKVPRLSVDEFQKLFGRVVELVKAQTGAEVLVFTTSSLEPGSREHNFGHVKRPQHLRRREMNIADGMIRVSSGLEDADDLIADFDAALSLV